MLQLDGEARIGDRRTLSSYHISHAQDVAALVQTSAVELLRIGLFLEIFGKARFPFLPLLFYIYSNSDNS